jgi:hypothetical protein
MRVRVMRGSAVKRGGAALRSQSLMMRKWRLTLRTAPSYLMQSQLGPLFGAPLLKLPLPLMLMLLVMVMVMLLVLMLGRRQERRRGWY